MKKLLLSILLIGTAHWVIAAEDPKALFIKHFKAEHFPQDVLEEYELNDSDVECLLITVYDGFQDDEKALLQLISERYELDPSQDFVTVGREVGSKYDPDYSIVDRYGSSLDASTNDVYENCGIKLPLIKSRNK